MGRAFPCRDGLDMFGHERVVVFVLFDQAIHGRRPFRFGVFCECFTTRPAFDRGTAKGRVDDCYWDFEVFAERLCEKVAGRRKVGSGLRGGDGPLAFAACLGTGVGFPFHAKLAQEVVCGGFNDAFRIVDSTDVEPCGFSVDGHCHVGLAGAQPNLAHEHVAEGDGFLAG
ncbi:MAG: hypothetical protein RIS92_168 [Verrucomicrobiota bacterium]